MIHYHGLPLTPLADMVRCMRGKHAMVSYAHREQLEAAATVCQSIVLDCGAYSAWQSGKALDETGYREWVGRWARHPSVDWHIIPDVIDGTEADNDNLVRGWPFKDGVPVFHLHEPLRRLYWLTDQWPRVAIGSSGEYSKPGTAQWWRRMADVMRMACRSDGVPWCKLHGLRMLDPDIFNFLPLASADSCSAALNVGLDCAWNGPYAPTNKHIRAIVMMDRVESHVSADRWTTGSSGMQKDFELIG